MRRAVHDADHLELMAIHFDPLADGIFDWEEAASAMSSPITTTGMWCRFSVSVKKRPNFMVVPPAAYASSVPPIWML